MIKFHLIFLIGIVSAFLLTVQWIILQMTVKNVSLFETRISSIDLEFKKKCISFLIIINSFSIYLSTKKGIF